MASNEWLLNGNRTVNFKQRLDEFRARERGRQGVAFESGFPDRIYD